ncbi:right-handed parallel beta-helix repeat-containing protein [Actinoplanes sp. LDG1-06]|uniref:Right-handed parallel beta-helix repeat-containing protein n=1 Tax=Paractinoplanes ovalisporus TaxID=2810368 RepID=A0ABS2AFI5_9ACTN|nr:right-handed parallel beta-helix repeat-containing protein [Actinoplanes ovalisporus]MBM2618582.1 right-handed parallel beta-helix repeat-containing protein [Actinoplanes ovalisporus]
MSTTRRNVLRAGVVAGGAAVLGQVGVTGARAAINPAVTGEDPATTGLRRALDDAANGIENAAGRDDRGRIIVRIGSGTTITLRDTLIIGGDTHLDARGARILAAFPTVAQTYTTDTSNAHSATPAYGPTFSSVRTAGAVSHATMVLNHVPSAGTGGYRAPGNIRIQGGSWDPIWSAIQGASTDDQAKATAAPPMNVITMQHTADVEIDGVYIYNVKWWHAIELNAVHTATVSNCHFLGWVEDPTVGLWHGEAVQLDTAVATTTWAGAADNTACANIRLVDNECGPSGSKPGWGRFAGSHTSVAGSPHTDVAIEFNSVTATKYDAVGPQDTQRLTIRGNMLSGCAGGIYVKAYANSLSRVDVVDNVVATTDAARPLLAVHDAVGGLTITDVAVFANTVSGPGGYWYTHASARAGRALQGQ